MRTKKFFNVIAISVLFFTNLLAYQDDARIFLRPHDDYFLRVPGTIFLPKARSDLGLGYYFLGSKNQKYHAKAMADVSFIQFSPDLSLGMDLSMETLVDDQNEIYFRLVRLFYATKPVLRFRLGDHLMSFGYQHRCSHGADHAVNDRIWIRSGIFSQYSWQKQFHGQWILSAEGNIYVVGQNADLNFQPRGGPLVSFQYVFPFASKFSLSITGSGGLEVITQSSDYLYFINAKYENVDAVFFYGLRLGVSAQPHEFLAMTSLHFGRNIDSGIGPKAEPAHFLALNFDFFW